MQHTLIYSYNTYVYIYNYIYIYNIYSTHENNYNMAIYIQHILHVYWLNSTHVQPTVEQRVHICQTNILTVYYAASLVDN